MARQRLAHWLRLRGLVEVLGAHALPTLSAAARLVALPPGHAAHPGPGWCRETLRGGALELGVGVIGVLDDPDAVTVLPPGVLPPGSLNARDLDEVWWPAIREHADRMGELATARLTRDGPSSHILRPVGGCDVLALLTSADLRGHLATSDGTGMRAVAVPMRTRGWFDLRHIDPAYVSAAWSATEDLERGLPRPLLVTRDEVVLAKPGGDAATQSLGRRPTDDSRRAPLRSGRTDRSRG